MVILGFDPGLATLGYGAVKSERGKTELLDYGVVLTPKNENLAVRLAMLEEGINKVIETFRPEEIAVEELFFAKNVTTGINVAHAAAFCCSRRSKNAAGSTSIPLCRSSRL